jgi:hypothetical protein
MVGFQIILVTPNKICNAYTETIITGHLLFCQVLGDLLSANYRALGKGFITWHNDDFSLLSTRCLPSARQKVLDKEVVAIVQFVDTSLPRDTR